MFYYFGLGLNLFLLILLISKKGKSTADKILACWLFVIGCHLTLYVVSLQPLTFKTIHVLGISVPFPFMHGPFLYLYTAAITNQLQANKKVWWLHFVPAAITIFYLLPIFLMSAPQKMDITLSEGRDYKTFLDVQSIIMQLSGLVYVIWSFLLLRKHKKNIDQQFSYEERINLNWLRYLIYAFLIVWVIIILTRQDSFIFGAVVTYIFLLGFFGIKQVGIFNNIAPKGTAPRETFDVNIIEEMKHAEVEVTQIDKAGENTISEFDEDENAIVKEIKLDVTVNKKKKYANSGLTSDSVKEIHKRLTQLMIVEKQFIEPELSLSALATRLNIHSNYLSQVINEKEEKSFYDYVNLLRVEEFKRLVQIPENKKFTMMSLALDCGFNSKSSFNKNFKKVTGQSPSEYLDNVSNKP